MNLKFGLFGASCLCLLSSCVGGGFSQPRGTDILPRSELKYPGFFDIGVGFGLAIDTQDGANNDAQGTLVSIKAYPAGRWYSRKKSNSAKAFAEIVDKIEEPVVSGPDAGAPDPAKVASDKEERKDWIEALINERDRAIAADELYIVKGRDRFANRISVFYGASLGEFSGGGLESTTHVVGLGYDFAPQLALLGGIAFYEVDSGGTLDTDSGPFFGVSLNLNAFKALSSAISN